MIANTHYSFWEGNVGKAETAIEGIVAYTCDAFRDSYTDKTRAATKR